MSRRGHFHRGAAPTFNCDVCGRRTRPVDVDHLCPECFELAGWDNHHNDNNIAPTADEMRNYEAMVADAVKKGGDGNEMRASFSFIWRKS